MNCISSQPAFHPCIPEAPPVAPPAMAPRTSSSPVGLLHLPVFDSVKSLVSLSRVTHCNPQAVFGAICPHSKPEFQLLSHSGQWVCPPELFSTGYFIQPCESSTPEAFLSTVQGCFPQDITSSFTSKPWSFLGICDTQWPACVTVNSFRLGKKGGLPSRTKFFTVQGSSGQYSQMTQSVNHLGRNRHPGFLAARLQSRVVCRLPPWGCEPH